MERVGGREEKMEGHCSTGQSPKWALVPIEEEEEEKLYFIIRQDIVSCQNPTIQIWSESG